MINNDEILIKNYDSDTLFDQSMMRNNIFSWIDFKKGGAVLLIFKEKISHIIIDYFKDLGLSVDFAESGQSLDAFSEKSYDYIVAMGGFDRAVAGFIKSSLKPEGAYIIAATNSAGISYRAGVPFYKKDGQAMTFGQLQGLVEDNDLEGFNCYYPYPDYRLPFELFSDQHLPKQGLVQEPFATYTWDYVEKINEAAAIDEAIAAGTFKNVANSYLLVSKNISPIEYAKFNSHRAPESRLATIIASENGKKYIEKRTLDDQAKAQLDAIETNKNVFNKNFDKQKMVECSRISENKLRLEFTFGKPLIGTGDIENLDALKTRLAEIFTQVFSTIDENKCSFEPGHDFDKFFMGYKPASMLGQEAYRVSNPDCIVDNFLINDETFCLDYEWIFDFPVPLLYLKYRLLHYLVRDNQKAFERLSLSEEAFLAAMGFSSDEILDCQNMELCFQQHVHGKDLRYIYLAHYQWKAYTREKWQEAKREIPLKRRIANLFRQWKKHGRQIN